MLRYKCLLLDHDDTIVESTRLIHYPAFLETLRTLRPEEEPISLHDFVTICHHPGFTGLCDKYEFDEAELNTEYTIWKKYTQSHVPSAYPGIDAILRRFKEEGGKIVVISHSESSAIQRDYLANFGWIPDLTFGWELGEHYRKPYPYPLDETLRHFQLSPDDCVMVDDLKLGLTMARSRGIDFITAGWSHFIDAIRDEMRGAADHYCEHVEDLIPLLFNQ